MRRFYAAITPLLFSEMRHSSEVSVTQTLISVALTQTKLLLVSACRLPATHLWKRSRTRPLNAALLVITTKQKTKQKQSQAQVKHQLLLTVMKLRVARRFTAQATEVRGSRCSTWLLQRTSCTSTTSLGGDLPPARHKVLVLQPAVSPPALVGCTGRGEKKKKDFKEPRDYSLKGDLPLPLHLHWSVTWKPSGSTVNRRGKRKQLQVTKYTQCP